MIFCEQEAVNNSTSSEFKVTPAKQHRQVREMLQFMDDIARQMKETEEDELLYPFGRQYQQYDDSCSQTESYNPQYFHSNCGDEDESTATQPINPSDVEEHKKCKDAFNKVYSSIKQETSKLKSLLLPPKQDSNDSKKESLKKTKKKGSKSTTPLLLPPPSNATDSAVISEKKEGTLCDSLLKVKEKVEYDPTKSLTYHELKQLDSFERGQREFCGLFFEQEPTFRERFEQLYGEASAMDRQWQLAKDVWVNLMLNIHKYFFAQLQHKQMRFHFMRTFEFFITKLIRSYKYSDLKQYLRKWLCILESKYVVFLLDYGYELIRKYHRVYLGFDVNQAFLFGKEEIKLTQLKREQKQFDRNSGAHLLRNVLTYIQTKIMAKHEYRIYKARTLARLKGSRVECLTVWYSEDDEGQLQCIKPFEGNKGLQANDTLESDFYDLNEKQVVEFHNKVSALYKEYAELLEIQRESALLVSSNNQFYSSSSNNFQHQQKQQQQQQEQDELKQRIEECHEKLEYLWDQQTTAKHATFPLVKQYWKRDGPQITLNSSQYAALDTLVNGMIDGFSDGGGELICIDGVVIEKNSPYKFSEKDWNKLQMKLYYLPQLEVFNNQTILNNQSNFNNHQSIFDNQSISELRQPLINRKRKLNEPFKLGISSTGSGSVLNEMSRLQHLNNLIKSVNSIVNSSSQAKKRFNNSQMSNISKNDSITEISDSVNDNNNDNEEEIVDVLSKKRLVHKQTLANESNNNNNNMINESDEDEDMIIISKIEVDYLINEQELREEQVEKLIRAQKKQQENQLHSNWDAYLALLESVYSFLYEDINLYHLLYQYSPQGAPQYIRTILPKLMSDYFFNDKQPILYEYNIIEEAISNLMCCCDEIKQAQFEIEQKVLYEKMDIFYSTQQVYERYQLNVKEQREQLQHQLQQQAEFKLSKGDIRIMQQYNLLDAKRSYEIYQQPLLNQFKDSLGQFQQQQQQQQQQSQQHELKYNKIILDALNQCQARSGPVFEIFQKESQEYQEFRKGLTNLSRTQKKLTRLNQKCFEQSHCKTRKDKQRQVQLMQRIDRLEALLANPQRMFGNLQESQHMPQKAQNVPQSGESLIHEKPSSLTPTKENNTLSSKSNCPIQEALESAKRREHLNTSNENSSGDPYEKTYCIPQLQEEFSKLNRYIVLRSPELDAKLKREQKVLLDLETLEWEMCIEESEKNNLFNRIPMLSNQELRQVALGQMTPPRKLPFFQSGGHQELLHQIGISKQQVEALTEELKSIAKCKVQREHVREVLNRKLNNRKLALSSSNNSSSNDNNGNGEGLGVTSLGAQTTTQKQQSEVQLQMHYRGNEINYQKPTHFPTRKHLQANYQSEDTNQIIQKDYFLQKNYSKKQIYFGNDGNSQQFDGQMPVQVKPPQTGSAFKQIQSLLRAELSQLERHERLAQLLTNLQVKQPQPQHIYELEEEEGESGDYLNGEEVEVICIGDYYEEAEGQHSSGIDTAYEHINGCYEKGADESMAIELTNSTEASQLESN